jgi:hypothetical protein
MNTENEIRKYFLKPSPCVYMIDTSLLLSYKKKLNNTINRKGSLAYPIKECGFSSS